MIHLQNNKWIRNQLMSMQAESKKLGNRIEFDNSTLIYALLNGLKPAIKGQVLAKTHNRLRKRSMAHVLRNCRHSLVRHRQKVNNGTASANAL